MKRGAYAMNLRHEMKFRGSESLCQIIKEIADQHETTVAATLRQLIAEALEKRQSTKQQAIQA